MISGAMGRKTKIEVGGKNPFPAFKLSIYIKGFPGSFQYRVGTKDQAMTHFAAITADGYRRRNDRDQLIWYAPSMIEMVKVEGPGLETNYPDEFVRT